MAVAEHALGRPDFLPVWACGCLTAISFFFFLMTNRQHPALEGRLMAGAVVLRDSESYWNPKAPREGFPSQRILELPQSQLSGLAPWDQGMGKIPAIWARCLLWPGNSHPFSALVFLSVEWGLDQSIPSSKGNRTTWFISQLHHLPANFPLCKMGFFWDANEIMSGECKAQSESSVIAGVTPTLEERKWRAGSRQAEIHIYISRCAHPIWPCPPPPSHRFSPSRMPCIHHTARWTGPLIDCGWGFKE